MSEWISVEEILPPKESILVFGKVCKMPHVAIYDYDEFLHTECCYGQNHHFPGSNIEFDYWMPLPEPPNERS